MNNKSATETLAEEINYLKQKQKQELQVLKLQFKETYESVKPINIIKNVLNDIVSAPDIKDNLMNNILSLATGYISKKVIVGATKNPIKNLLGTILEFAVASFVSKHGETIKNAGEKLVNLVSKVASKKQDDEDVGD